MPVHSFTEFFRNLLNHENITVRTGVEALERITVKDNKLYVDGEPYNNILVYTGALDELFSEKYGRLPYRSLRFEYKYADKDSLQDAPVVAYPQEKSFTRITEYRKFPSRM